MLLFFILGAAGLETIPDPEAEIRVKTLAVDQSESRIYVERELDGDIREAVFDADSAADTCEEYRIAVFHAGDPGRCARTVVPGENSVPAISEPHPPQRAGSTIGENLPS